MNQKEAVHERLKEYACVAPDQMMQKLQINAEGITQEEAIIRRQKYGNNAPSAKNKDTMFYCIRRAFVNPFSTILFFLFRLPRLAHKRSLQFLPDQLLHSGIQLLPAGE